ncbi:MAG: flexitail domain-containing putative surface protein [Dehalococcoidia bacterium]
MAVVAAFIATAAWSDGGIAQAPPGYTGAVLALDGSPAQLRKDPKLSTHLAALADHATEGTAAGALPAEAQPLVAADRMRFSVAGEVQVFIHTNDSSPAWVAKLEREGARIERVAEDLGLIQAQVRPEALRRVAALSVVERVRLPDYPVRSAGTIQSEGDAIIQSDDTRTTYGIDGTGVTVGVISDGVGGLINAQALGDLPAVDTATCNITGGDPAASGAEGTALLEIVHDVAPGASLMFGNFGFGTMLDFNAAVDCLAANADVVVDDISWIGVGPYDGTSIVSANTAAALNSAGPIKGYYTSVGNFARRHYQGEYVDSGIDINVSGDDFDTHEFAATGGSKGTVHAGFAGAGPLNFNRLILGPGSVVSIILVWDDPWGASGNDYDLFAGSGTTILACSTDLQDGDDDPVEGCGLLNSGAGNISVDIMFGNLDGAAAPVEFDLFVICGGCVPLANGNTLDFTTTGSSVPNQSDAGGSPVSVVAVGAVPQSNPAVIEGFSSLGLTEDGRLKPDLVAPDGVCVSGSGGFKSGNPSCQTTGRQFFGTSAAAPHVAGVAALLLDCDANLSREALWRRLTENAADLGVVGPDNVFGHGLVDALASADATSGCGQPTKLADPGDTDGDGCSDQRENGLDEMQGGLRDYQNAYDFYDVSGDGVISLQDDILPIIQRIQTVDGGPPNPDTGKSYGAIYDRGLPIGPYPWNRAGPDGVITLQDDILGAIFQYQHDCT